MGRRVVNRRAVATFPQGEEEMQSGHICPLPVLDSVDV